MRRRRLIAGSFAAAVGNAIEVVSLRQFGSLAPSCRRHVLCRLRFVGLWEFSVISHLLGCLRPAPAGASAAAVCRALPTPVFGTPSAWKPYDIGPDVSVNGPSGNYLRRSSTLPPTARKVTDATSASQAGNRQELLASKPETSRLSDHFVSAWLRVNLMPSSALLHCML